MAAAGNSWTRAPEFRRMLSSPCLVMHMYGACGWRMQLFSSSYILLLQAVILHRTCDGASVHASHATTC